MIFHWHAAAPPSRSGLKPPLTNAERGRVAAFRAWETAHGVTAAEHLEMLRIKARAVGLATR